MHWTPTERIRHHCTPLNSTALRRTALHCPALHSSALNCIALHCTELHFTALHCTALYCTALHCTVAWEPCVIEGWIPQWWLHCGRPAVQWYVCAVDGGWTGNYCTVLFYTVLSLYRGRSPRELPRLNTGILLYSPTRVKLQILSNL